MATVIPPLSLLERFPLDLLGNVISKLIEGPKGTYERGKIPNVINDISQLALSSKKLRENLNEPEVIHALLFALSERFQQPPENFAAKMNTAGAREWLWKYIRYHEDDKTYEVIQKICLMTTQVFKEAYEADLEYCIRAQAPGGHSPFACQTKQGFWLYITTHPTYLATPLGKIELFGSNMGGSKPTRFSISELLIKRLNGVFETMLWWSGNSPLCEIVPLGEGNKIRKIDKTEIHEIKSEKLPQRVGGSNLIVNSLGNESVYKIQGIEGEQLPNPLWHFQTNESPRDGDLLTKIWKMLRERPVETVQRPEAGREPKRKSTRISK